ncbi:hypothetical protein QZM56_34125, partial [Burkholderia contaminans]|nr:hypothetical protein [Burkholderia contaminans]
MADVMHTVGLVVYPNFQSLALAVASVFEYANLLRGEEVYQFRIVSGASQASCRLGHAANGSISVERVYVLTMQSRSGFSVTAPIGVQ